MPRPPAAQPGGAADCGERKRPLTDARFFEAFDLGSDIVRGGAVAVLNPGPVFRVWKSDSLWVGPPP
jgi:hypothetical protein